MNKLKIIKIKNKGFTLIEMVIYSVLLSFLLASFISYAYVVHIRDLKLNNEIKNVQN